jgi:deferrochelatase/peroxidase EfeB
MAAGRPIGRMDTGSKPPADTGEAVGLPPSELTVTFGFGPSLFGSKASDRFGLASRRPAPLADLPAFPGDALDPAIGGGDLGIQACANDPQVAFHAVHELIRIARPAASPRWLLAGAGRTGNSRRQPLPRNIMGFQDGTANIKAEDTAALDTFVWAGPPNSPAWMHGGSYLVVRRIQILLGKWDKTGLDGQRRTIGRNKVAGDVLPVLPPDAHILLASPTENGGQQILRRGYGYLDGIDQATGAPAGGLLFLCYQRDPRQQFVPIQARLATADSLNKFITHIGSAIFACPPGAEPGEFIGQGLLP